MSLLYPQFAANRLPDMIRLAVLGAAIAGIYGAAHDQISYAISPEYFTKLKFHQFAYADFGWPPRVFASEVGFLATWWVGLIAGWFLARAGLIEMQPPTRSRCTVKAFAIVVAVTLAIGVIGLLLGILVTRDNDLGGWGEVQQALDIRDIRSFVIVAYLHGAGYLGAVVGLVMAIAYVRRGATRSRSHIDEPR